MKKLLFLSVASFITTLSFSQTAPIESRTNKSEDPKLAEFMQKHDDLSKKQPVMVQKSDYMGYDETLKSYFEGNMIPQQTPKYSSALSRKEYVQQLNNWIAENKQFLKPEHKSSLITE